MCRVLFGIIVIAGILLSSMFMATGIRSLHASYEIMVPGSCDVDTYTGQSEKWSSHSHHDACLIGGVRNPPLCLLSSLG